LLLLLNSGTDRLCHPYLISCIPCKPFHHTTHHTPDYSLHSSHHHSSSFLLTATQDQHPDARTYTRTHSSLPAHLTFFSARPSRGPLSTRRLDASSCPRPTNEKKEPPLAPFLARQHCSSLTNPAPYESSFHLIIIIRQPYSSLVCCIIWRRTSHNGHTFNLPNTKVQKSFPPILPSHPTSTHSRPTTPAERFV
jgi:hypothetical protein